MKSIKDIMIDVVQWYPIQDEQGKIEFIKNHYDEFILCLKKINAKKIVEELSVKDRDSLSIETVNSLLRIIKHILVIKKSILFFEICIIILLFIAIIGTLFL